MQKLTMSGKPATYGILGISQDHGTGPRVKNCPQDQAPSVQETPKQQPPCCIILSQPLPSPSLKAMSHLFKLMRQVYYHWEIMINLEKIQKQQKKVKKTLTALKQQQQQGKGGISVYINQGAVAPYCIHPNTPRNWKSYQKD